MIISQKACVASGFFDLFSDGRSKSVWGFFRGPVDVCLGWSIRCDVGLVWLVYGRVATWSGSSCAGEGWAATASLLFRFSEAQHCNSLDVPHIGIRNIRARLCHVIGNMPGTWLASRGWVVTFGGYVADANLFPYEFIQRTL